MIARGAVAAARGCKLLIQRFRRVMARDRMLIHLFNHLRSEADSPGTAPMGS
jgi:hypothetical protein